MSRTENDYVAQLVAGAIVKYNNICDFPHPNFYTYRIVLKCTLGSMPGIHFTDGSTISLDRLISNYGVDAGQYTIAGVHSPEHGNALQNIVDLVLRTKTSSPDFRRASRIVNGVKSNIFIAQRISTLLDTETAARFFSVTPKATPSTQPSTQTPTDTTGDTPVSDNQLRECVLPDTPIHEKALLVLGQNIKKCSKQVLFSLLDELGGKKKALESISMAQNSRAVKAALQDIDVAASLVVKEIDERFAPATDTKKE